MSRISEQQRFAIMCQGEHLIVTIEPVGFAKKFSAKSGMSGTTSENALRKTLARRSRLRARAKLFSPSNGRNKMQPKVPSMFGKAISMNDATRPDVQCMCFHSMASVRGVAGIVSSL